MAELLHIPNETIAFFRGMLNSGTTIFRREKVEKLVYCAEQLEKNSTAEITRLRAALAAANEDAERLAGCVQNVINISDEDSWPVSRRALEAHKERIAK